MTRSRENFSPLARLLHWTMAPLILAMLFVGVGMVATISRAHSTLIAIHKPLGIALLLLVVIRACVRLKRGSPPLPDDMPAPQQIVAKLSHLARYALMAALPLIGWAMVPAAGYPVTLLGALLLPPNMPHHVRLYPLPPPTPSLLSFSPF